MMAMLLASVTPVIVVLVGVVIRSNDVAVVFVVVGKSGMDGIVCSEQRYCEFLCVGFVALCVVPTTFIVFISSFVSVVVCGVSDTLSLAVYFVDMTCQSIYSADEFFHEEVACKVLYIWMQPCKNR